MPSVTVDLADRSYQVLVEPGLIANAGERVKALGLAERVAVVTDSNVAKLHAPCLMESLEAASLDATLHVVPAGEPSKSFEQTCRLCTALTEAGHDRKSLLVAVGGGVVGDLGGFVASIFYRGIPLVHVPTTIVSQVDSSVGGKTGINLPEGKNLVGAFHQPRQVLVDPGTLSTLPPREFREGLAEVIKHAAIRDAAMLGELANLDPGTKAIPADLIARNIAIKARIVEDDEYETTGTRALLNFGHTIGHAIEAAVPYGDLLHGEAISLGLRAALFLSERRAGLTHPAAEDIVSLLGRFELPLTLPEDIKSEDILKRLARDKKFSGGKIRFVLLRAAGDAFVSSDVSSEDLREAINHLRS